MFADECRRGPRRPERLCRTGGPQMKIGRAEDSTLRAMGVDYGTRRIGLALSDPTGTLATPLTTLVRRAGKRAPIARILELARQHQVDRFVLGLPLHPREGENRWTAEAREFGRRLRDRSGLSVHFVDESYSSAEAEAKIRVIGLKRAQREDKARIDAGAAAIILQDWLDARALDPSADFGGGAAP